MHGFDEFFGNLYHLNAEEEPELPDYPKDPAFKKKFGPRGVLHCVAPTDGKEKRGRVGKQKIGHRPADQEADGDHRRGDHRQAALAWMEKQAKADQPFFLWYNSTAMHFRTHLAEKNRGKSGQDDYSDRMVTHDEQIGQMLDKLDELGIADNTIVMYSTDNGPENDTWPDGANTPFRSQKDTNWEGGWRVPCVHPLAGQDQGGHGPERHLLAQGHVADAAGHRGRCRTSTRSCSRATRSANKTFKVHIDGYNMVPYLTGEVKESPRQSLLLLQRRRRRHGGAGRRLEVGAGASSAPITMGHGRSRS